MKSLSYVKIRVLSHCILYARVCVGMTFGGRGSKGVDGLRGKMVGGGKRDRTCGYLARRHRNSLSHRQKNVVIHYSARENFAQAPPCVEIHDPLPAVRPTTPTVAYPTSEN